MSEINFIASNDKLEELSNDTKSNISNNKTIIAFPKRKGINVLDLCMPSITLLCEEQYKGYNITKKYVYGLDYRWQKESVEKLIDYFKRNMKNTDEIEFWSIWLDESERNSEKLQKKVLIEQLDYQYLEKFYNNEQEIKCLKILNGSYKCKR